ncbi:MAG: methylated-DNA--[protein]-cysteine S-methyltransferase [Aestuariivita sp.]|nr:methylated-DNA--[protein]-cysteine S-methyltransferase [Aestuariivita sp.]
MKTEKQKMHKNYDIIFRALKLLRANSLDQTFENIAFTIGMKESQLKEVFCSWANVDSLGEKSLFNLSNIEKILQHRMVDLEDSLKKETSNNFPKAKFVDIEKFISLPENVKDKTKLKINWGWLESPFGPACIMATEKGICGISFAADCGKEMARDDLMARWPHAEFVNEIAQLEKWTASIFSSSCDTKSIPLHLIGTSFQIEVWNTLCWIPFGKISTYSEIAKKINRPSALRAVGSAVGANPVSWLIPCHRALRKSGGLGGYHWGLPLKHAMLTYESIKAD